MRIQGLATVLGLLVAGPLVARAHAAPPADDPPPDVVELADGTRVEGRVLLEDERRLVVRVGSKEREIERSEVQSVRSAARSVREALAQWERIDGSDANAILDLARFCEARGLAGEAELFAYLVLTIDPKNEAAHLLCGHDRRGDDWIVRDGAQKHLFSRIGAVRQEFRSGWRLRTTHYELATNLDLASACTLLIELELFYRQFQALFGGPLELYEIEQPMPCQVHADQESYPDAQKRIAYFDPRTNTLFELAVTGYVLEALLHEATHQLLWSTAVLARKGRGSIPDWLDEGLAEYLASLRTGSAGRPSYTEGPPNAQHFRVHAEAKKPYGLSRLQGLAAGDFAVSSKVDLKYAQAYTLVHFGLNGDGQKYRAGFFDYLRRAYAGKATSSSFEECLGQKERELEKAWTAHVQRGGKN